MNRDLLRRMIIAFTLLLPVPALAAGFTCATSEESGRKDGQDEPEEVSAYATETVSSPRDMQAWLRRLVGRYTYDGYVDPCGRGYTKDRRPVTGKADCIAISPAADVHCKINVNWPAARKENGATMLGGVSNLAPAQFLFSIEYPVPFLPGPVAIPIYRGEGANHWGVVFVQVDSNGIGEFNSGVLVDDTFLARESCKDISGDCHRITRITARPESNEISMTVEVVIDRARVLRQVFLLHRDPGTRKSP